MGVIFPLYGPSNPRRCAALTLIATPLSFVLALGSFVFLVRALFHGRENITFLALTAGVGFAGIIAVRNYRAMKWALREYGCRSAFRFLWLYILRPPWRGILFVTVPLLLYLAVERFWPMARARMGFPIPEDTPSSAELATNILITAGVYFFGVFVRRLVQYYAYQRPTWNPVVRGQKLGTISGINSWLGQRRVQRDKFRLDQVLAKVAKDGGVDKLPQRDQAFLASQARKAKLARKQRR
jgi:hypothetical protein